MINAWNWDYRPELDDYYYSVLLPGILDGSQISKLTEKERRILDNLRAVLTEREWSALPQIVRDRRAGRLTALTSDRAREDEERAAEKVALEAEEARRAEDTARVEGLRREEDLRRDLKREIDELLVSDFLSSDSFFRGHASASLVSPDDYLKWKMEFVKQWAGPERERRLDSEQASAVATYGGDVRVVARAGSGKTRTLVARAEFLIKHCRVSPDDILLLAFNQKAAQEIGQRLKSVLGNQTPHAMTFHALAHALVHPDEKIIFDDGNAATKWQSSRVQMVINAQLAARAGKDVVREIMLAYFREDWQSLVSAGFDCTPEQLVTYRKGLARSTLGGHYVRSGTEKAVANALFEHGVEYGYQWTHTSGAKQCRADFTLRDAHLVIDCTLREDADDSARREKFWAKRRDWTRLVLTEEALGAHGFEEALVSQITKAGVECRRLSNDEIWKKLLKKRALDEFSKAMKAFVARCRKAHWSPDQLAEKVGAHEAITRAEKLFLEVANTVYRQYLRQLREKREEDFDGLLLRATQRVQQGKTRFSRDKGRETGDLAKMRFILIDEFQDFSAAFYGLLQAIRGQNERAEFFCVGDDWQAIYAFAGSDLEYYDRFGEYFRSAVTRHVSTNYRSKKGIVRVGNAVMRGNGEEARADSREEGWIRLCPLDSLEQSPSEAARHLGDDVTPAVLRLLWDFLERQRLERVAILMRRHYVPWRWCRPSFDDHEDDKRFLEHLRSFLPTALADRVDVDTAHSFKGKERPGIIVVDAVEGSYPLVHPHWIFLRIFGDAIPRIVEDERRLFYVAVTRAESSLALITEASRESPFVQEIRSRTKVELANWGLLPPPPAVDGDHVEIRVFGFEVKDQLKKEGYKYSGKQYWSKSIEAAKFDWESICKSEWNIAGVRVEVLSEEGQVLYQK